MDQTTPLSYAYIEQVLKEEFAVNGLTLEETFAYIDSQPLASASIAQVHAARLHNGDEVVLKVQKPDVETIMQTDLGVLHGVTKLVELLMPSMKICQYCANYR